MPHQTTPHTESQANQRAAESDLEPGTREQTVGTGEDAANYANAEGAQTGTNRNPKVTGASSGRETIPMPSNTLEGSVTTRTPGGETQGITSHSANEESARQEKVVKDRPDAQAGVSQRR